MNILICTKTLYSLLLLIQMRFNQLLYTPLLHRKEFDKPSSKSYNFYLQQPSLCLSIPESHLPPPPRL